MTVPVFVNVFNRLTLTRSLCDQIARLDNAEPIIIDNASAWQPLLDWYAGDCPYQVLRLPVNAGHHAPWTHAIQRDGFAARWGTYHYAVTDCDLDLAGVPLDALTHLATPFTWGRNIIKAGLSLRIDDLPPWQSAVRQWESRWWRRQIRPGWWDAKVDTTFAVYDIRTPFAQATKVVGIESVRADSPHTARHVPWYLDATDLDAENANYFATATASNSWRPSGRGLAATYAGR